MPCVSKSNVAHENLVLCYKSMELNECACGLHARTCVDRDLFVDMRQMENPTGAVHSALSAKRERKVQTGVTNVTDVRYPGFCRCRCPPSRFPTDTDHST